MNIRYVLIISIYTFAVSLQSAQQLPLLTRDTQQQIYMNVVHENAHEVHVISSTPYPHSVIFRLRDGRMIVAPRGYWLKRYKVFEKKPYIPKSSTSVVNSSESNHHNNEWFEVFSPEYNQLFILRRIPEFSSPETTSTAYVPPVVHQSSVVQDASQDSPMRPIPHIVRNRILYQRDATANP